MNEIKHAAVITQINKESVIATIKTSTACSSCSLRSSCGMNECKEKNIEIQTANAKKYSTGDNITIIMTENNGFIALLFGYTIPLILVLITLFGSIALKINEITSGIYSIIILIPYYFGLSLCRKYFAKKINFTILEDPKTE